MLTLHPTLIFLAWIALAIAIPGFSLGALGATSALLVLGVGAVGTRTCWRLVRRTRTLFIAMIVLYAFATPGMPIFSGWDTPTQEGVLSGTLQAWRL